MKVFVEVPCPACDALLSAELPSRWKAGRAPGPPVWHGDEATGKVQCACGAVTVLTVGLRAYERGR